ncbi:MAG: hypothetical protein ETSY2_08120 [Candidatus Entotheonella gemina]|uniref:Sulfatase-modifying factor enzyme-like domain-containing protein n=1 Tax=Candidatus Entotheonella gemina TaxID=1429439 RepID=W4MCP1_9BACT|nr:MAG: hypothetical protein ETSY2_08120 [Candidatus Entotheonella gemina]
MRLHRVFDLQPAETLDNRRHLKAILRAVVVKSNDDQLIFDRVFESWLTYADQDIQRRTDPMPSETRRLIPEPALPQNMPSRKWRWVVAAVLVLVIVSGFYGFNRSTHTPPRDVVSPPKPVPDVQTAAVSDIPPRERSFTYAVPRLEILPAEPQLNLIPLALCLLALLAAGVTWRILSRRSWLPEPAAAPTRPGPPRVFLTPPSLPGPQFLDPRQQETLVWGIGKFVAEEPTRRLDVAATVRATAHSGGVAELHFERATYQREVWLWVDEMAMDAAVKRLVEEVESTLRAYGLPVQRAVFRGIPERLLTEEGAVVTPREWDEHRDDMLVAVLTDGRVLSRQYVADDRRVGVDALLRELSHWPRLAFVDLGEEAQSLSAILQKHELPCILPEALAAFLGDDASELAVDRYVHHHDAIWAAVCALAPGPVDEGTALALRQGLGLAGSPWAWRALRTEAPGPPGRLQWAPALRAERINWLRQVEGMDIGAGWAGNGLLDRALSFWQKCYDGELEARDQSDDEGAWRDSPARQHLCMECHLVRLWQAPEVAIPALYGLYQGRLGATIRQQLGHLIPHRRGAPHHIQLPWTWETRSATEKVMLQEMGLGGEMPTEHLKRPGRFWLGLGACAGLALAALIAFVAQPFGIRTGPPLVQYVEGLPDGLKDDAGYWIDPEATAEGQWRVSVTAPKSIASQTVDPIVTVRVAWEQAERPCVETLADNAELWRCGHQDHTVRLPMAIKRSLVVIASEPGVAEVEALAIALLSSGSADVVLVSPQWLDHRQSLIGVQERLGPARQLILIAAEIGDAMPLPKAGGLQAEIGMNEWSRLTERLRQFRDVRRLSEALPADPAWRIAGDVDEVKLKGLGDIPDVRFVDIPAGEFLMGSPDDEPGRSSDEGPQHLVRVGAFLMAETETTNAQFHAFKPDHQGPDGLPATSVSWHEAREFCETYGWRLPTEAEWEYAVRAGTTTRWSFGDDERQLGNYAWFFENAQTQTKPARQLKPNPWGLYDMYGNVIEWVQDCWNPTYDGASDDGSAWETGDCSVRVLRGGWSVFGPEALRSARRDEVLPEARDELIGFRCVRRSRRQP